MCRYGNLAMHHVLHGEPDEINQNLFEPYLVTYEALGEVASVKFISSIADNLNLKQVALISLILF